VPSSEGASVDEARYVPVIEAGKDLALHAKAHHAEAGAEVSLHQLDCHGSQKLIV